MSKFSLNAKLTLLLLIPLVAVASFGLWNSYEKWRVYHDYVTLAQNSAVLRQIGNTVHELQKERGRSAGFITSNGIQFSSEMGDQRRATDHALAQLNVLLTTFDATRFGSDFQRQLQTGLGAVGQLTIKRAAIGDLTLPVPDSTAYYTNTIGGLLDVVVAMSHLSKDAEISNGISSYVNFLQAKEQAGIERAVLTGVFVANTFSGDNFRRFSEAAPAQSTFLRVFESFASKSQRQFVAAKVSGPTADAVIRVRQLAFDQADTGRFGVTAGERFEASSARINLMKEAEDRLADDYDEGAAVIRTDARRQQRHGGLGLLDF